MKGWSAAPSSLLQLNSFTYQAGGLGLPEPQAEETEGTCHVQYCAKDLLLLHLFCSSTAHSQLSAEGRCRGQACSQTSSLARTCQQLYSRI